MIKIHREQIEKALNNACGKQNAKYGHDVHYWDYEIQFEHDNPQVLLVITFSTGDVTEEEIIYG